MAHSNHWKVDFRNFHSKDESFDQIYSWDGQNGKFWDDNWRLVIRPTKMTEIMAFRLQIYNRKPALQTGNMEFDRHRDLPGRVVIMKNIIKLHNGWRIKCGFGASHIFGVKVTILRPLLNVSVPQVYEITTLTCCHPSK